MRKYLAAGAMGLLLIAGQAAASEDGLVQVGDRLESSSDAASASNFEGSSLLVVLFWAAITAGLSAWGVSQSGSGAPASP
jgi:hypothetical protein